MTMTEPMIDDTLREALWIAVKISAPILAVALIAGVVVGLFQALTSVQEPTLTFVPKLLAAVAVMGLAGPWMLTSLVEYLRSVLMSLPTAAS